ncbi:KilA-N domain-containing protein [Alphaentomopoxvirus acuprea]|uniref:KilA-N domain-containing protein n=1 Tax=Alphaentomopoxvirus acuprea TaxID=62099 RepID=W6JLN4_9POXV|nr:KilA-N domain-containing protein [Anomala cuprea entomopoxvirus]BAO49561.1 KilA-N domain-containing protein [Anomala cuprea entomopoxvirus]
MEEKYDITCICFELIKKRDNYEFHKALYGDFIIIMIRSDDYTNGYINGTKLCKDGGKRLDNWTKLEKTKEMINEFNKIIYNIPPSNNRRVNVIYRYTKNDDNIDNKILNGTYFHPNIIVHIASWISIQFAFKVSKIINNHLIDTYLKHFKHEKEKIELKIQEYDKYIEEKNNCITNLEKSIKNLNITFQKIKPKIINTPIYEDKYSTFAIFKLFNNYENDKRYYIITVCERDFDKRYDNLLDEYPNIRLKLKLENIPNAKYLFDNIKEYLTKNNNAEFKFNTVTLLNISESTFLRITQELRELTE